MAVVSYRSETSRQHAHIEWIELHADGMLHECAVMKRMADGNILFFKVNDLDQIDKRRLALVLSNRNANAFELWDLMSQQTLGNGMNTLAYFNQLVMMLTPNGKIVNPRSGAIGGGVVNVNPVSSVK